MGNPAGVRRDFEALEKRRFQAVRLLDKGLNQSEVARRVKVVRQTVARWVAQYRQQGAESLRKAGRAGRKPLLSETDRKRLEGLLLQGPEAIGYETPLWNGLRIGSFSAFHKEMGVNFCSGSSKASDWIRKGRLRGLLTKRSTPLKCLTI